MLFHWSWSDEDLARWNRAELRNSISELIRASRKGHHLVSVSRSTTRWLLENMDLANYDRSHLISIGDRYAQTGGMRNQASVFIEISPIDHHFDSEGSKIRASPRYISTGNIIDRARLVVENIDNDGWLFGVILDKFRKEVQIHTISFDIIHGGGKDIVRVFRQLASEGRVGCLITDSDKKFPGSPRSLVLRKSEKICQEANSPFCFVKELPCHEIENMIPLNLIKNLQAAKGHAGIPVLESIASHEAQNGVQSDDYYWIYFDVKNGISEKIIEKWSKNCIAWHDAKLSIASIQEGNRNIEGFGENIIPQLRENGQLAREFVRHMRNESWARTYRDIFIPACWVFVGEKPTIT